VDILRSKWGEFFAILYGRLLWTAPDCSRGKQLFQQMYSSFNIVLSCEELDEPEHGSMQSTLYPPFIGQDIVVFSCYSGYALIGNRRITCDILTQTWSGASPVCEGKLCLTANQSGRMKMYGSIQKILH